jgi:hypothetical protein
MRKIRGIRVHHDHNGTLRVVAVRLKRRFFFLGYIPNAEMASKKKSETSVGLFLRMSRQFLDPSPAHHHQIPQTASRFNVP